MQDHCTDHHAPLRDSEKIIHINPHLAGIDGMTSASASAMCMLFAIHLDEENWDLLPIAFAGISGDRQAIRGLSGINKWLFEEGTKRGIVKAMPASLVPSGPLADGLCNSIEPYIRGINSNPEGARGLLEEAGIPVDATSTDIYDAQRVRLSSLLVLRMVEQGVPLSTIEELIHERYYFPKRKIEAGDLASLLNACGRSDKEGMGVALTLGDPEAMAEAQRLRKEYTSEVLAGLDRIAQKGVTQLENIQYFHNDGMGLSGILCGVTMQYLGDRDKPTIALSPSGDKVKISSRGTFELLDEGIDLAEALRESAAAVSGTGGGHRIAAGAMVPRSERRTSSTSWIARSGSKKLKRKFNSTPGISTSSVRKR